MRQVVTGFLSIIILAGALAGTVVAQSGPSEKIRGVIQSQIDAFRSDDVGTAFTYASPGIRRMFGSPDRFGMMVQQGYPMVWRPRSVEFLDLREIGGRLWQVVLMQDASGAYHTLRYQMQQDDDGVWRINGVQILREEETGV